VGTTQKNNNFREGRTSQPQARSSKRACTVGQVGWRNESWDGFEASDTKEMVGKKQFSEVRVDPPLTGGTKNPRKRGQRGRTLLLSVNEREK